MTEDVFKPWLLEESAFAKHEDDGLEGVDPSQVWGVAAYGFGIDSMQEAHVYDDSHPANVLRRAVRGGAGAEELDDEMRAWTFDRKLEVATWDGEDHPDTPFLDDVCHGQVRCGGEATKRCEYPGDSFARR